MSLKILSARGDAPGIVCILSAMESCRCFKVRKNHKSGYLELQWKPGKCLHYYVYLMDPEYGLVLSADSNLGRRFDCNFISTAMTGCSGAWQQRQSHTVKQITVLCIVSDFQRAQSIVDTFDVKSLHRRLNQACRSLRGRTRQMGPRPALEHLSGRMGNRCDAQIQPNFSCIV